ncbi:MAG: DNA primase family protein, partial [Acidimicrobiales bacterium]
ELRAPKRADLMTKCAPVEWDPDATCPAFDAFLERVLPEPEVRDFLCRGVGYSLTGDVGEHVLFIAHGSGANGKSTLLEVLSAMLGDYAAPAAPRLLIESKIEAHPTNVADLHGRRFVVTTEIGAGHRFDESLVKWLTGGDTLKARRMRENFWEFKPTHKLWVGTNHKPRITGTDEGIWRRVHLIPFDVTIPPEERDPRLPGVLRRELPGILRWAVQGCLEWQECGLMAPDRVNQATELYRYESDVFGQFLHECCTEKPGFTVVGPALYGAYDSWCAANGLPPMNARSVAGRLRERGFDGRENRWKQMVWDGLGLLDHRSEPDPRF